MSSMTYKSFLRPKSLQSFLSLIPKILPKNSYLGNIQVLLNNYSDCNDTNFFNLFLLFFCWTHSQLPFNFLTLILIHCVDFYYFVSHWVHCSHAKWNLMLSWIWCQENRFPRPNRSINLYYKLIKWRRLRIKINYKLF